jgi:hypothetical protein
MGIRITAFAFKASRLQKVLGLPLWQLLGRLCQTPAEDNVHLFSVYDAECRQRYYAGPDRGVIRIGRGQPVQQLDESALSQIPLLRQTTAQYLAEDAMSSYQLAFLLRALAAEATSNVARMITNGHRPWWIGSSLAAAKESSVLSRSEFNGFRDQCARIIRVYECGFPLADVDRRSARTLPFLPTDDADYCMSLFDAIEARRFVELLDRLLRSELRFVAPPPRFLHGPDAEWNSLVRDCMAEFLKWRALSPPHDHLVTFIG